MSNFALPKMTRPVNKKIPLALRLNLRGSPNLTNLTFPLKDKKKKVGKN